MLTSFFRGELSSKGFFYKTKFSITGKNNRIIVDENAYLEKCSIFINGNNNTIRIGKSCTLLGLEFWIEDTGGLIELGNTVRTFGGGQFASIEGRTIRIGDDCLFAKNIQIRTGDSHSIIQNGKRINPSKDVCIANHVWIGADSAILKGVTIGHDSVIGTKSLITKDVDNNCIVVGSSGRVIKKEITWDIHRI